MLPQPDTRRQDWTGVLCFLFGEVGHRASRCPNLDITFPCLLPGWKAEKVGDGYIMISPRVMEERRRAENGNCPGGGGGGIRGGGGSGGGGDPGGGIRGPDPLPRISNEIGPQNLDGYGVPWLTASRDQPVPR